MTMSSYQHITPPLRLFHGPDSLGAIARELDRLDCRRAMLVCGNTIGRAGSPLDLVRAALGERCVGTFSGVRAHSPLPSVEAAARELKQLDADAVIAVGGGSAIVTARAASILMAEGGDAHSLCTTRDEKGVLRSPKLLAPKLPQLIVPTTPTTAIVKAGSAVLDPVADRRLALFDPKTRAQAVFIHPDLIATSPRELLVSASLNTLAMAVEGLMSHGGDPLADALLTHALRLVARQLSDREQFDKADLRGELMLAAVMCGQGTDYTGAGITSVLGHAIGARFHLENGVANAIILPHGLRFNADAASAGIEKVAVALGLSGQRAGPMDVRIIDALEAILGRLGIPRRLRDAGVPRDALGAVADGAMEDWFLRGNPRPVREAAELLQVLEEAW